MKTKENHFRVPFLLMLSDAVTVACALLLSIWLRSSDWVVAMGLPAFAPSTSYASLWPLIPALLLVRLGFGLYPGYALSAPEALKRQTHATTAVFTAFFAAATLMDFADVYSRMTLVTSGLLTVLLLPITHALTRILLARTEGYGVATDIIGTPTDTEEIATLLRANPLSGLRPANILTRPPTSPTKAHQCLIVVGGDSSDIPGMMDDATRTYRSIMVTDLGAPHTHHFTTQLIAPYRTAAVAANALLDPFAVWVKRLMDVALVMMSLPLTLPMGLLVALGIMVTDGGPVFFGHARVGKNGREFKVWKFRSMRRDAQERLKGILESDPVARRQWEESQKLDPDPRVTRVGRFLRSSSLDELPQLWNVLKGEMSLVGPRAVTRAELARYGTASHLYTRVLPGVSGLWQVSGRSETSYTERVRLDAYYVRNWSVWLDLVITARTFWTVLMRRGAT